MRSASRSCPFPHRPTGSHRRTASTAASGPSTASANLVAPNARVALAVTPVDDSIDTSDPATIDVRGFDALDGSPARGLDRSRARRRTDRRCKNKPSRSVRDGTARVAFRDVALGMNLVSADANVDGKQTIDVAAVTVAPRALSGATVTRSGDVKIVLDKPRQKPNERTGVTATLAGSAGDALITMESVRGVTPAVVSAQNGSASTQLIVPETIGALAVGVVFVRDGAMVDAALPLVVDGPGHQRQVALSADRATYAPSSSAKITDHRRRRSVRLDDRRARERSARVRRRIVRRHLGRARVERHDDAKSRLARSAVAHLGRAGEIDGGRYLRLRSSASNREPRHADRRRADARGVVEDRSHATDAAFDVDACRASRDATCSR